MKKIIASLAVVVPVLASAQIIDDVNDVTAKFTSLGNTFIQILIAFSVIFIIFNVVRFLIVGASDEEKRKSARQAILWGIVGLFVILSIWGLVRILTNTFRTDNTGPRDIPSNPIPRYVP